MIDITTDEQVRVKGSQLVVMSVQSDEETTYVAIEDVTEGQMYEFAVQDDSVRQQNPIVSNDPSAAELFMLQRTDTEQLDNRH